MRYYRIDKRNKAVVLSFRFDKELVERIKKCKFQAYWNTELKHWLIPVDDWSKNHIIEFIKAEGFIHKPAPPEVLQKFNYFISDAIKEKLKLLCEKRGFTYTPRDYQLDSLHYGLTKGNFINGDDVGLGKTFEAIIYAEATLSFPCIVVCPASVKYNWAEKWAEIVGPHRTISVIESSPPKKRPNNWNADVVIINYDIIGKKVGKGATVNFPELMSVLWKMFIFDEGHFLKEDGSQRSKAAKKMTAKSEGIIQLLTGTATMSRPSELWNLLVLIKKSHLIAENFQQFALRYCAAYKGKFGWVNTGATNTIELNTNLRTYCYLRREKRDVLKELPDIETVIIKMPITNQKDIKAAEADIIQFIRDTKGDEKAESAMEAEALVALNTLRKLAIDGKMKAIEQYLRDWKVGGKKLLIFGIHRENLEYLADKFNSKLIAGGITSRKKQQLVKEWMANDDTFLFANMQSAGTGVDGLQEVCSNMLILELPWRPSDLQQVVARIDRSGQTDPSTVRYMLNYETIDRDMWEMLEAKEANTEAVNKGIDVVAQQSGMRMVMKKIMNRNNLK
jgi:SWI/SNF-related matrix-associated actin-dependent regulator 1 of chromatin subfamily A